MMLLSCSSPQLPRSEHIPTSSNLHLPAPPNHQLQPRQSQLTTASSHDAKSRDPYPMRVIVRLNLGWRNSRRCNDEREARPVNSAALGHRLPEQRTKNAEDGLDVYSGSKVSHDITYTIACKAVTARWLVSWKCTCKIAQPGAHADQATERNPRSYLFDSPEFLLL
jgi:hypothetical protein